MMTLEKKLIWEARSRKLRVVWDVTELLTGCGQFTVTSSFRVQERCVGRGYGFRVTTLEMVTGAMRTSGVLRVNLQSEKGLTEA